MDITRKNFVTLLPEIEAAIAECDFVALDCELSGLRKGKAGHLFDDHEERYVKLRDGCMDYKLIQLGLSCFKRGEDGCYQCTSYNVYVFPYKVNGLPHSTHLERNVELQASAIQFLRQNGFDFNFLFDQGIGWLNVLEEREVVEAFEKMDAAAEDKPYVIPQDQTEFVNNVVAQIESFIKNVNDHKLDLPPSTPYQRKLIYEYVRSSPQLRDAIAVQTCKANNRDFLSVTRLDKEAQLRKRNDTLAEAKGVSKLIEFISHYNKPVVGHNVLLDLMHLLNQFVAPLPATYAEFKEMAKTAFPTAFDTKFISSTIEFKEKIKFTSLSELYETLSQPPFETVAIELNVAFDKSTAYHQAGYDSFITGKCFAILNEYLRAKYVPQSRDAVTSEVQRYANKLHVTYSFDFNHLYITGDDITLDRRHVFFVSFPDKWQTSNLVELFSAYGQVTIGWLDARSALVGLRDASKHKQVKKSFENLPQNVDYNVLSYEDYLTKVKCASADKERPLTKRKLVTHVSDTGGHENNCDIKRNKAGDKAFAEVADW